MLKELLGRTIRSKHTYSKGKILGINEQFVIVTFTEEEAPMVLTYETFLNNCLCDDEVRNKINERIKQ